MDDQNRSLEGVPAEGDEEFVRGLLESAGPRPAIPQEDLQAISAAARSAWQGQVRRPARSPFIRPAFAVAAGLAAVVIGLTLWWSSGREIIPTTPGARVVAVAGLVTMNAEGSGSRAIVTGDSIPNGAVLSGATGRTSLRLLNGTIVRLDRGARIRLLDAEILELEQGALYADTGGQAGKKIEVRTQVGTARDIGTQFVVRLAMTGAPELHVLVREGSVVVDRGARSVVTAGRELVMSANGSATLRDVARYGADWEWIMETAGGFNVEGRSLRQFLDWVGRETGWSIRYANDELAASARGIILHGGIGELRPDQAPFVVLPSAGLECVLHEGTLAIRRSR